MLIRPDSLNMTSDCRADFMGRLQSIPHVCATPRDLKHGRNIAGPFLGLEVQASEILCDTTVPHWFGVASGNPGFYTRVFLHLVLTG